MQEPSRRALIGQAHRYGRISDRRPGTGPIVERVALQVRCKGRFAREFPAERPYRWPVVIRILRTRVEPNAIGAFRERAQAKVADARKVPGVIDVHLGNQADGKSYEFVFISRWATVDALYAWAGGRDLLERPIYFDGLEESIVEFDIQHYIELDEAD
jgi:hypothetical protein